MKIHSKLNEKCSIEIYMDGYIAEDFSIYLMYQLICQKPAHLVLLSGSLQICTVLGMCNFALKVAFSDNKIVPNHCLQTFQCNVEKKSSMRVIWHNILEI